MQLLTPVARRLVPRRYRYPLRQALYDAQSLLYRGDGVFCPWCGRSYRRFLNYGGPYPVPNLNTYCPRCRTMERHRLLWLYFRQRTNLFSAPLRMLHFAPEPPLLRAFAAAPNLTYVSLDIESSLAGTLGDITRLPFGDGAFDVVLCSHVLEHVPDDAQAMRELRRVLRPGGWALVLSPVDWNREQTFEDPGVVDPRERERLFGQHDHVRIYGGPDYIARLRRAGFDVRIDRFAAELDAATVRRYALNVRERLYVCT